MTGGVTPTGSPARFLSPLPMAAYDLTALRLAAARNLGYTAGFRVAQGRDFTGSRDDYRLLAPDQQSALGAEMFRIIRADPSAWPAILGAVAAGPSFGEFGRTVRPPSVGLALLTGAGQGLADLPDNLGRGGAAVVHAAGTVLQAAGTEVNRTAGSLLGFKFSTLAWAGAAGLFLYFLANSPAGARSAAWTVERLRSPRR